MDTIDNNVMQQAAEKVIHVIQGRPGAIIHTVTVTLNGQHGGADVITEGVDGEVSFAATAVVK